MKWLIKILKTKIRSLILAEMREHQEEIIAELSAKLELPYITNMTEKTILTKIYDQLEVIIDQTITKI
jgi:hypothetical protein